MSTIAIELNDTGLAALGADTRSEDLSTEEDSFLAPPSPGYAILDKGVLVTGAEARSQARLRPRRSCNRFWSELTRDPLGRPFPAGLSAADLAHSHLLELCRSLPAGAEGVLLVVPGSFSQDQLGLVLGVTRAAELRVTGLVDAALTAVFSELSDSPGSPAAAAGNRILHLDIELQRAVLTELEPGASLARRRVWVEREAGLAALESVWARFFSATFVSRLRFDPLHSAESEQRLFLQLPEWLRRFTSAEAEARVELVLESIHGEQVVEVSRRRTIEAVDELYRRLGRLVESAEDGETEARLVVSHRVGRLPGLVEQLVAARANSVETLAPTAALAGALAARHLIETGEELPTFVLRLPLG
jgi:hypothetical protein